MKGRIKLRVKGTIPGHAPGSIVEVVTDDRGIPLDAQWRRRLKDAAIDECVEVVEDEPSTPRRKKSTRPAPPAEPADDADGSES